jgi:RHS repeat-associated protein
VGRETSEKWLNGSGQAIRTFTFSYDQAGRLTAASDPSSSYAYGYDAADRLTSVDNQGTPNVPHVVLNYGYDGFNNQTGVSDSLGGSVTYGFDAGHRLTAATLSAGTASANVTFGYDTHDRLTAVTRQAGGAGPTVTSSLGYDNGDRLTSLSHSSTQAGSLANYSYGFDAANRVTTYTGPEGTLNYSYYSTGEVIGVSGAHNENYSYDLNGNRNMAGYQTGPDNRLTNDVTYTYTYDNEGNMLTKTRTADGQQWTFSWDYRNRLTEVVVKTAGGSTLTDDVFTYDVEDRRIGKSVSGSAQAPSTLWTVYDGDNAFADFNGSGSLTARYLYGLGLDDLLGRVDGSGNLAWYLTDELGSVRQLVTSSGTVLDQLTYDSYGNILTESSAANGDRFNFSAREWDGEIGQYSYRARPYSPSAGRFESEDPSGFGGGDSNLYRYGGNGPTNAILSPAREKTSLSRNW